MLAGAHQILENAVASGTLEAAVLQVESRGESYQQAFGSARPETVFLLASITKPMTAAAVMTLVENGRLGLDEPAQKYVPELAGPERAAITVRSLLDHRSGLPDLPPENQELRRRQAPLGDFLTSAARAPLLFPPGSAVRYQSMGFLVAGTIVERITGLSLREHMRRALFTPLGLGDTSLGLGGRSVGQTARCQVPDDPGGWNSPYWRDLGSPWGGAHGTAGDLVKLLRFFAHPQAAGPLRIETVQAMLTPSAPGSKQTHNTPSPRARERYGLGWRLGIGGEGSSPETFGHAGATGALAWTDPTRDLTCILLTTWPSSRSQSALLTPVSNAVSKAFS
jgi:CubicO group peptidase (beta-lactamase class C family)